MKHTCYYLITPRQTLVKLVNSFASDSFSDLVDPVIWSGSEADKSILQPEDNELLVKLLFIDTIIREQSSEAEYEQLFSGVTRTENYFDSRWVLKRVQLDMLVSDAIEDAVVSGSISEIHTQNPRVKEVLKLMSEKKY